MGPSISLGDAEFVAQYELTTGNFNAEFGRNSGSVVNIVTKSGTNDLHGSLYATESNWRFNSLSLIRRSLKVSLECPLLMTRSWEEPSAGR